MSAMSFKSRSSKPQRGLAILQADPCGTNAMPHVHLPVLLPLLAIHGLSNFDASSVPVSDFMGSRFRLKSQGGFRRLA